VIGIALLGAGFAGRRQLEGWQASEDARVVGVWNRTAERAASLARQFDIEPFADLDGLLSSSEVDAVDIATAMDSHLELGTRAAEAGKHVLCQKPLAASLEDAQALVDACSRAGVRLMVNENFRWRPWYRAARQLLDEGAIGSPFYLRLDSRSGWAIATNERPPHEVFAAQPFLRQMTPLILLEVGVHYMDVARFLFGDPHQVYARTLKVTPPEIVRGEEVASLMLAYPDRTAVVEMSWASVGYGDDPELQGDTMAIEGSEGSLFLDRAGRLRLVTRNGSHREIPVNAADFVQVSWASALHHFADRLQRGEEFDTSGAYALETLRLVLDGYESARSDRAVPQ
jgi:predicted dehydrogenase